MFRTFLLLDVDAIVASVSTPDVVITMHFD